MPLRHEPARRGGFMRAVDRTAREMKCFDRTTRLQSASCRITTRSIVRQAPSEVLDVQLHRPGPTLASQSLPTKRRTGAVA